MIAFISPLREKRAELAKDTDAVIAVLKDGGTKIHAKVEAKMNEVREKVGIKFY